MNKKVMISPEYIAKSMLREHVGSKAEFVKEYKAEATARNKAHETTVYSDFDVASWYTEQE